MSAFLPDSRDSAREQCVEIIAKLVSSHEELLGALISSADGFEIAAVLPETHSPAKLAAMTSSLVALGEAVSDEAGVGGCVNVVIESQAGRLLLMDIPGDSKSLLTVVSDNSTTLGHALWAVRECALELALHMAR